MTPAPEGPVSSAETSSLPPPRLKPGDQLAGRFRVIQLLAHGGMGEVYEATDSHLQDKRHAIKTLRSDLARDPSFRLRFEREVLLAREVHHPNVCPTYDLFQVADGQGPLTFLTMKLLVGESLHTRIRRERGLPAETVRLLAVQIAAALDAAHARGVVHRDLKPGNIMLEDHATDTHVSVTDFGLSRAFDAAETIAPDRILGTPGYMAPEIMRGQTAGYPADVYAFGIVVYEMLTGRRPDDPLFPKPPSDLVPGLDAYWDKVVHGCLSPHPDHRFRSAGEALALGPRRTGPLPDGNAAVRRRRRIRALAVAATMVAVLTTGWAARVNWDRLAHPLPEKRYVAVMGWPVNAAAQHQPLLRTAIETIGSRLSRAESSTRELMIINASDVGGTSVVRAPTDAVTALGANLVLATAVEDAGPDVRITLSVIEAASGRTLRTRASLVPAARLSRLSDTVVAAAARLLDLEMPSGPWKDQDEIASLPPAAFALMTQADELAARANDTGLEEAIASYQKLVESQPKFALGYARLSDAYGRWHRRTPDRAVLALAARNADTAIRFNPDSVAAKIARADVHLFSGDVEPALTALENALDLDPGNPQVLGARARAFRALDRMEDEEAAYRELVRVRPNYWPAYDQLGLCLFRQARYAEAAQAFSEGLVVGPQIVRLFNNLGAMQLFLGNAEDATATFKRSVAIEPTPSAMQNLGTLAFGRRDYAAALTYYQKAQALSPRNELIYRNIGDIHSILGNRRESIRQYELGERLLARSLAINAKSGEGWMISAYYQAKLGRRGDAEAAMRKAEQFGASGIPSQLKKVQTLVLLGRGSAALDLLIALRAKGLSSEDVELAIDLRDLRSDPRYLATLPGNPVPPEAR